MENNKLIATFYYRGQEEGILLYRRVIVSTIGETLLYGFETTRDILINGPVFPFKTYKLTECSGLIIKYIEVPDPKPALTVAERLRNIAAELEAN